ncbi:2-phosphoglycerate kinase [Thermoplasmatales archaeon]|nr:2-phosphoglycerate kinase [Thermoplasmatales archaeon]
MNQPTIVLIGGIPGVGKTSMAGEIAKALDIDIVLSGDYLREFIRPFGDYGKFAVMGTSVYDAWKYFGEKNRENVISGFLAQSEVMNTGLNAILRRALNNGENMVVEQLHFVPSQLEKDVFASIIPLYLYIKDIEVHRERLRERVNFTHSNSPGERLAEQLETYRLMMEYSMEESRARNVRIFESSDYHVAQKEIISYVTEQEKESHDKLQ